MAEQPVEPAKPTDWTPTRKVTAGAVGGALATLIVSFLPAFGVEIPGTPGIEAAIGTLATLIASYLITESA